MYRTNDRVDVDDGYHLTMIDRPDREQMANYLDDPGIANNTVNIPSPYNLADADSFIDHILNWEEENGFQKDWAIRDPHGQMIGSIGLIYDHGVHAHKSGMGYWLARPFWNQGLMTKSIKVFCQHIFQSRQLIRLEAHVFPENVASIRCLEKAHFAKEGHLKKAFLKGGEALDAFLFARLA